MAETIARVGIKREPDYMYFIKGTSVYKVRRKKKGVSKYPHEKVASFKHERDNAYVYFVDKHGDVARAKRGGGKRRKGKAQAKSRRTKSSSRAASPSSSSSRVKSIRTVHRKRAASRPISRTTRKTQDPRRNTIKKALRELDGMTSRLR